MKRGQGIRQVAKKVLVGVELVGVRVVAALLAKIHTRLQPGGDEGRHFLQRLREHAAGILRQRLVVVQNLRHALFRDERVHQRVAEKEAGVAGGRDGGEFIEQGLVRRAVHAAAHALVGAEVAVDAE